MSAPAASRLLRHAARNTTGAVARRGRGGAARLPPITASRVAVSQRHAPSCRSMSASARHHAGLMPDQEVPQAPQSAEEEAPPAQPTALEDEEYHTIADAWMDAINEKAEAMQEAREDVEVEYSSGVFTLTLPSQGTYVINKQPPNKQIWLSSPISGPKRFDWVLDGEGQHEKEGSGEGEWVYLRDGSNLTEILRREVGILVDLHGHGTEDATAKPSTEAVE